MTPLPLPLAALSAVVLLALAYPHDPVAEWDDSTARWVAREVPVWVEWLARPFSWIGGFVGMTLVVIAAAGVLLRGRRRLDAALIVAAAIVTQLTTSLVKELTDRPRPSYDPVVSLPSSDAFPSGHASVAMATFCLLAVLERRTWTLPAAAALALAIGLSRIALGVHFVSDVVAGWCLGLACLGGCLIAREALRG